MSSLAEAVTEAWYQSRKWILVLMPFTFLFWIVSRVRRCLYRYGFFSSIKIQVPVIVVGNISVGGTGKSPLTAYLVEALKQKGYSPGVVSRGYGGKSVNYPVVVDQASKASEVGDEPVMLYQMMGCPIVVDPIRSRAASKLCEDYKCDLIICDDGLQHYGIDRDVEICVIDSKRGLGNGWLLPVGPLRESRGRLATVDFVIVNGDAHLLDGKIEELDDDVVFEMSLRANGLVNVFDGQVKSLDSLEGCRVHGVAGIGNPDRFFEALTTFGAEVIPHSFPDHHIFTQQDLKFDSDIPVVMTHKDAVKLRSLYEKNRPDNFWYMPVNAEINESFIDGMCKRLDAVIKSASAA